MRSCKTETHTNKQENKRGPKKDNKHCHRKVCVTKIKEINCETKEERDRLKTYWKKMLTAMNTR